MEDEPTQPATQLMIDPRRLGQGNSGLTDDDLSDIFCILHPASLPAYKAAALIAKDTPQHTISAERDVKIRQKVEGPQLEHDDIGTFDLAAQGIVSCDLALRLSANLKNLALGGFLFGRNKARCDLVLGQEDEVKRVSNIHFRIYINEYGVIMLEDQSTNGTVVDGVLLRAKDKENGKDYRHTLELGSMIVLTMTPPEEDFRFIVRIPQRDDDAEFMYQNNLANYYHRQNQAQAERRARVMGPAREPLNIFATPDVRTPDQSTSSVGRHVREWRGGSKYNKVGTIGKGAFAVVYKVTAKFDGVPFAAKELEKRRFMKNGVLDQKVEMEMNIMRKIQHANIVQYIEHIDWEEYLYIIMEYIPEGDLGSLINERGCLPEIQVKLMATQLLSALKYLHQIGITHRDVKPDNILIHRRKPLHVKLTDFGLSKMVDSEETFLRTFCGTLLYCAPEVYSEYREYDLSGKRNLRGVDKKHLPPQRYGHAVDIWSLAGVLFFALCGTPPYPVKNGTTYQELLNHIMTKPLDIRPLQLANISEPGIRFVKSMLHIRPDHRASITELESSSWFTGEDSLEMSVDEMDEVDMIGDYVGPQLEEGASQLSIQEHVDREIGDREGNASEITEMQQETPISFDTSENSIGNGNESYGFMANAHNNPGNGRLFGEIDASVLGSSGAIPFEHLPLPEVNHNFPSHSFSRESLYQPTGFTDDSALESSESQYPNPTTIDNRVLPKIREPPITEAQPVKHKEADDRATRSSSLMGAESMVGHLNMASPSPIAPPSADITLENGTAIPDAGVSLRRQREEEDYDPEHSWRPFDLPSKKRHKSTREIDILVPKSIFWDPKDPSTHHTNYPPMSMSDFKAYQDFAAEKGERFVHGETTFETTMRSFRTSRSPSLEPEAISRAHSEPTKDEGRRMMMKRDERTLGDEQSKDGDARPFSSKDNTMPSTARGSHEPETGTFENGNAINIMSSTVQPVVGNDFQRPKRILGKIIGTPESCLPTITLNITETITSWGRGYKNTIRYSNGLDIRVPKYAFKIFLFKPKFYTAAGALPSNATPGNEKNANDQDMAFYISNKASSGIHINGFNLPSHDRQNPYTASKFWGELRHGDIITVWKHDQDKTQFTQFKFECYWGVSKQPRAEGERFQILPPGDLLTEIENVCLAQEKDLVAEIERREAEEKLLLAENKKEKAHRESLKAKSNTKLTQSFIGAQSST